MGQVPNRFLPSPIAAGTITPILQYPRDHSVTDSAKKNCHFPFSFAFAFERIVEAWAGVMLPAFTDLPTMRSAAIA
jgi:hypothetical protein